MDLKEGLLNGDKRAAARLISMVENRDKEVREIIRELFKKTGSAQIIGITGPPGAGKSTLTDKLAKKLRAEGKTVGIIAVDPTSPFTGGAILGDRVRMSDLATDDGVFIRSLGSRGSLGGISRAVYGAVKILDILGMDYIFIETVGVGQSEVDIVKIADTVVVVSVPGLGDDIQVMKAGIMEIADVFAINKSDREGADRTFAEINSLLDQTMHDGYRPEIISVIARDNKGIPELLEAIGRHRKYLESSGLLEVKKKNSVKSEIIDIIKTEIMEKFSDKGKYAGELDMNVDQILDREKDPYSSALEMLGKCID